MSIALKYIRWSLYIKSFLFCISDLISNPVLATFPKLLEEPDVMDALRVSRMHHHRNLMGSERDSTHCTREFWCLLLCVSFSFFGWCLPAPVCCLANLIWKSPPHGCLPWPSRQMECLLCTIVISWLLFVSWLLRWPLVVLRAKTQNGLLDKLN